MKILVIGANGREDAICWLAGQSPAVERIFYFGKNAGMACRPKCQELAQPLGISCIIDLARRQEVDFTIVGPEQPLADGIVDQFRTAGLSIFGPTQAAAALETDKAFAKKMMAECHVPTANARLFAAAELDLAKAYVAAIGLPLVVKAIGLAGGKGAMVCRTIEQAIDAIERCLVRREFGPAGDAILIEEFLAGPSGLNRPEVSVLAVVDAFGNFKMFPFAQDHKPAYDGDQGPNTGGMGSFAPVSWVSREMMDQVAQTIFTPIIAGMKARGTPFSGVLYAGLMWTASGFKVVEFNVRLGDPEIQPLSMLLKTDLIPVLKKIADGESIADVELEWKSGAAVCVVIASHGYPQSYRKGALIKGLDSDYIRGLATNGQLQIFHAGTKFAAGSRQVVTDGGRVLGVTAFCASPAAGHSPLAGAARIAYQAAFEIDWLDSGGNKPQLRTDIANSVPPALS